MHIDTHTYFTAATEHVDLARRLYFQGDFVYAIYISGVSVECMLRAHLGTARFDSRHDLRELLRESEFLHALPDRHKTAVAGALSELWMRWRNTHRFFSLARLRRFVIENSLHRRVKGDPVKENARRALAGALIIVDHGAKRWKPSSKP